MGQERDIENKVRRYSDNTQSSANQDSAGKNFEDYQSGQNQLLEIHAAQRANLQSMVADEEQIESNNEILAQAGELISDVDSTSQVQNFKPQTQELLNRYGINGPKTTTSRRSSREETAQNIVINNNTENTTTNNVQVPSEASYSNPSNFDDNKSKFKTWMSGIFLSQEERSKKREKEYQKREWSLSRSTNKLMKSIENIGKNFAEKIDPKKVGSSVGSQMKQLLVLLGIEALSSNWDKVVGFVTDAADFFGFGKEKSENKESRFVKAIKGFLGGDSSSGKGVSIAETLGGLVTSGLTTLWGNIKLFFQDRADAVKAVQLPKISKGTDILDTVKMLGGYLGDILSCLMGGEAGLSRAISNKVENAGSKAIEDPKAAWRNKGSTENTDRYAWDVSYGDASMEHKRLDGKNQNWINELDYKGNKLTSTAAGIRQSMSMADMIGDTSDNTVNVAGVMTGFKRLESTANSQGGVTVASDFLEELKSLGIDPGKIKGIVKKNYKYIQSQKTEDDYKAEGAGNADEAGATAAIKQGAVNTVLGGAKPLIEFGTGIDLGGSALGEGAYAWASSKWNRTFAKENHLTLVPNDKEHPGKAMPIDIGDGRTQTIFPYFEISPEGIENIKSALSNALSLSDFDFDSSHRASYEAMEKALFDLKKKKYEQTIKEGEGASYWTEGSKVRAAKTAKQQLGTMKSDLNISTTFGYIDEFKAASEQRRAEFKESMAGSQYDKFKTGISDGVSSLIDSVGSGVGNLLGIRSAKKLSEGEIKKNALKAMEFFISKGLSEEAAAGLVGNLMRESGMNPRAVNPNGGAYGLAQWLGERKSNFEKVMGKSITESSFEDQLEYIWHELNNTHTTGRNKLQGTTTPEKAAMNAFGYYEFSVGPEGAVANMNKHGQDGGKSLKQGIEFARDIMATFRETSPQNLADNNTTSEPPIDSTTLGPLSEFGLGDNIPYPFNKKYYMGNGAGSEEGISISKAEDIVVPATDYTFVGNTNSSPSLDGGLANDASLQVLNNIDANTLLLNQSVLLFAEAIAGINHTTVLPPQQSTGTADSKVYTSSQTSPPNSTT